MFCCLPIFSGAILFSSCDQGLLPVPPRGRHRARKPGKDVNPNSLDKSHKVMQLLFQTGAPRLGHHPLGQRLRRVGQAALPGARQGSLEPPRCDAKHKVQGVLREGALRGQPKVPRREGIQVGGMNNEISTKAYYILNLFFRSHGYAHDFSPALMSWSQFCKEPLPDRSFTFWDWFHAVMKLTKEDLRGLWIDRLETRRHLFGLLVLTFHSLSFFISAPSLASCPVRRPRSSSIRARTAPSWFGSQTRSWEGSP